MKHDFLQAQRTAEQRGSSDSPVEMQEPSSVLEKPTISVKFLKGDLATQPRTEECFVLTTFRSRVEAESSEFTDKLQNNTLYEETSAQTCGSVKPPDQSNRLNPQQRSRNARCAAIPLQNSFAPVSGGKLPYPRMLSNTDLEVFERIGGGSFGQVWKGAVFDVAGDQEWSDVAVKMLKGKLRNVCHDELEQYVTMNMVFLALWIC